MSDAILDAKGKILSHLRQGRLKEAAQICRRALAEAPEDSDLLHLSGLVALQEDRLEEARHLISEALAVGPATAKMCSNLGIVLVRLERFDEAIACFEQALRIDPDYVDARFNRGMALKQAQREDEAIEALREALAADPDHVGSLCNLGNMLLRSGQFEEAERRLRAALALSPDLPEALVGLGFVLNSRSRWREALDHFQRADALRPDFPGTKLGLSTAFSGLGRIEDARAATRDYVRLDPIETLPCQGQVSGTVLALFSAGNDFLRTTEIARVRRTNTNTVVTNLDRSTFTIHMVDVGDRFLEDVVPELPPFDVVLNQITEPDNCREELAIVRTFVETLDCPVMNRPQEVLNVTRDGNYRRFWKVPGLLYPKTTRLRFGPNPAEQLARFVDEEEYRYPVIVRKVGTHTGATAVKIEDPAAFEGRAVPYRDSTAYVIQYIETSPDGRHYNRMRMFSVGGRVIARNIRFSDQWNTHEGVGDDIVEANTWMQEADAAFIADPVGYLGEAAYATLDRVIRSVGLDFFGLDFTLLPTGDVLMFEINPAMRFSDR